MAKATATWAGHKVKFDIESESAHSVSVDDAPVFGPRAFKKIEITFVLGWDGKYDKEKVDQAIDLACNRYCPIHATLTHGTKVEHRRKDAHN